jgi:NAD+ synthase (glutamine-hydrolysing)
MRLALAQINPTVGDLPGNHRSIMHGIDAARRLGADVVAFPELALCGYPPEDLLLKPSFLADCRNWLDRTIAGTTGIAAIIGFPEGVVGNVGNAAAVASDGRPLGIYRKALLPNYGVFDEFRYFKAGDGRQVWEYGGVAIGISICEDIWHPHGPPVIQAQQGGARLLINISASPYHAGKGGERADMLVSRARDCGAVIAYLNAVGGQDELVFDGQSLVIGADGRILARGPQFEEDLILIDLEIPAAPAAEAPDPLPVIPRTPIPLPAASETKPSVDTHKVQPLDRVAEVYHALVTGTRDYVLKNNFAKVVIGLSGGVDSSLTACVAVDALGADNVVGVAMPSPYSSPQSLADAGQLAQNLGIELKVLSIEDTYKAYLETLSAEFAGTRPGVAEENVQARIRGNLLMALSNKFGWLVLTTGNKSELAVGYCTLYGDMAGGFAVVKDIPKTLVYELANWRNAQHESSVIPEAVIAREPTAELRPNQRDTDSLPPYPTLDPILHAYVEEDRGLDEIVQMGFERDLVRRIIRLVDQNEYKRRQAPPGVKITHKAFGRDRRLPITNRYVNAS